ncbi:tRNA-uridine aminocarboxypropyltransferase [Massilia horti]|uniref:tRNA-uridine aminocarboxypropyltransferase n=1 Tax=Massilia horti TaxID=2562153 RepID=A0A4Y9SQG0_9BURK|nr:tRNA-uridine aminocarboxypropyltransferase [Massilia horti]TFW27589.1 DTW domain-containing protein [Massilia horti]
MIDATKPKRPTCATCLRAQAACICGWIAHCDSRVELLILQHPLEVGNAKNSARLLHLCVGGSRLLVGETFAEAQLLEWLYGDARVPVLLYPETPGDASLGIAPPPALNANLLGEPARLRLVVIDATWRKSRKMLYTNPLLQRLPRLALRDMPASNYRIRKAHAPDQLSTLEASAHALMQLHDDTERFWPLLTAFDGFVAQQARYAHA